MSPGTIADLVAATEARPFGNSTADDIDFVHSMLCSLARRADSDTNPEEVAGLIHRLASGVELDFWTVARGNQTGELTPAMQDFVDLALVVSSLGSKWCEVVAPVISQAIDRFFDGAEMDSEAEETLALSWLSALADEGGIVGQLAAARALITVEIPLWKKRSIADRWFATFSGEPLTILASFRRAPQVHTGERS